MEDSTPNSTTPHPNSRESIPARTLGKHSFRLVQARFALEDAEADLNEAQLAYMNSLAEIVQCLREAKNRIKEAIDIDSERLPELLPDFNDELRAQLDARLDWFKEVRKRRKELTEELVAWEIRNGVIR